MMTIRDFLGFVIDPKNNIDIDMPIDALFCETSKYFYTAERAAEELNCGLASLKVMIMEGRLRAYKLHGVYYIYREDLMSYAKKWGDRMRK